MKYEALLFDFDGTLLNTNELILQTFEHVLSKRFPGKYTKQDYAQFIGPSLTQTFLTIAPSEVDELTRQYREFNVAHHDELVTQYDDVVTTLQQLKMMGVKLAIVSTKRNDMLARGLHVLDAAHLFDVVIGTDDVTHVKPHPEPVQVALKKLQVAPNKALMIGDNSHDIEAGHNAGTDTAGVAWALKGEAYLQQFKPTYIVQHMQTFIDLVKGE